MSFKKYTLLFYIIIALLFLIVHCDDEECPKGYWGRTCQEKCEENCNVDKENCNKSTGICPFCKDGFFWKNNKCTPCPGECKITCTSEGCDECKEVDAYDFWCNKQCVNCSPIKDRNCDKLDGKCLGDCKTGFYGPRCDSFCPSNCNLDVSNCEKATGNCPKCKDGFYGNTCEKCPPNCKTCLSDSQCIQCNKKELYGNKCEQTCSSECADVGKQSLCSITDGTCFECNKGKYGPQCQYECPPNCAYCNKETGVCLECNDSFYLYNGKCMQCPAKCATCKDNENCSSCVDNFYSEKCNKECPETCEYLEGEHCDFVKGTCLNCKHNYEGYFCERCIKGYWGDCTKKCEVGCDIDKENCDKKEAICNNCKPLYYGIKCEYESTTENCIKCDKNGVCIECESKYYLTKKNECLQCPNLCEDRICTEEKGCNKCIPGYYGLMCQEKCSLHCKDNICERETGHCSCEEFFEGEKCDRCVKGHTGDNCKSLCGKNCDLTNHNCNMDGECEKCNPGFYSTSCEKPCSENCLGEPDIKCEKTTGACSKCKNSYYGEQCTEKCKANCEECKKEDGICTKCQKYYFLVDETKECINCPSSCSNRECTEKEGCKECFNEKTYGKFCQEQCPENCESTEKEPFCNRDSGNCFKCKESFSGTKCLDCIDGKYGENCDKSCAFCSNKKCKKDTGECGQCEKDYWGKLCTEECNKNCDTSQVNCSQDNGDCSVCQYGYYTNKCILCSEHCELECDFNTGVCKKCKDKRYGDKCENKCSSKCEGNCNKESGDCYTCIEGHFGKQCESECKGCLKNCSKKQGECENHECKDTHYGPWYCNSMCSSNCKNGTCDLFTGFCKACSLKKWGKECEKDWLEECNKDDRVECNEAKVQFPNQFNITLIGGLKLNSEANADNGQKNYFPILKCAFGSKKVNLNVLVDFDSNSPLVVFDKERKISLEDQSTYLQAVYNSSESTTIANVDYVLTAKYELFDTINGNPNEETIYINISNEFESNKEKEFRIRFVNPDAIKLKPDKIKITSEVNAIIGFGFLSSFSQDLFKAGIIEKNVLIVSDSIVSFGDYTKEIKNQFSTLSTLIPTESFKFNSKNNITTFVRGFTSNYGKGYKLHIETTISYSKKTDLIFPISLQSYFEKLYFGSMFSNNECELKEVSKGIKEYSCNRDIQYDSLPSIGLVIDDYIYYLNESDLFEVNERKHFKIKLMKDPKIVLGREFLNHYSLLYNQGNGTISLFGNTKKLFLELIDIPKEWPDLSNTGWFTPGTIALLVIFGLLGCFIFVYIANYCIRKKKKYVQINEPLF